MKIPSCFTSLLTVLGFWFLCENALAATHALSIPGSQSEWLDTGVILDGKNTFTIKATGTINYCGGQPQCDATPDGSVSGEAHCGGGPTDAGGLCGALIVRIGGVGGSTMEVGSGFTFPKTTKGRLEIGIQDFKFDDNSGTFSVTIKSKKKEKFDLSGYVLGSTGTPFPRELVVVTNRNKTGHAKTDSSGRFQFSNLSEGRYTVKLSRTLRFTKKFTALDGFAGQQAFQPPRIQANLTSDLSGQNFTARQFSTIKAPMRTARKTEKVGLCDLKPAVESGLTAQVSGLPIGTKLRLTDSFFASGTTVKVIGEGPYDQAKFVIARLQCEAIESNVAGIGLPLNTGGAESGGAATVEIAPSH